MTHAPTPASARNLDIADHVATAYRTVIDNAGLAVHLAIGPFVVALVGEIIAALLMYHFGHLGMMLAALILLATLLFPNAIFAVRWHRFVLLAERDAGSFMPPGWGGFAIGILKLAVILGIGWMIMIMLAALPPHVITMVAAAVGSVALLLLSIGLLMIFPAAAIGRGLSLRAAWTLLEGNYWRFFLCLLGCYLPFMVVNLIVVELATGDSELALSVTQAIHLVVIYPGIAVVVALLSQVYRELAGL